MKKLVPLFRCAAVVLSLLFGAANSATAQLSIGVSTPGVSIGIHLPVYPEFVRVPNYPVYYAPRLQANYFFYDGMYWVYQQDNWYASSWYDGPWWLVAPQAVPVYVLRIPVRYYRNPPRYFGGWQADAPPRWGEHWGNDWSRQRSGWDRWNRRAAPAPAPLPTYQRQYSGERYPRIEQQQALQSRNYRYQPREAVVRQHVQQAAPERAPAPQARPAIQERPQPPRQRGAERREVQAPDVQDKDASRGQAEAPKPEQGQGRGKGKTKDKGKEPDRENSDEPGQQRKK